VPGPASGCEHAVKDKKRFAENAVAIPESRHASTAWRFFVSRPSPLFELARVLVRLDHIASVIVNANHSIMRTGSKLGVTDCIADCVRLAVREPGEWRRVGY
jgi:hypothetical protein